MFEESVTNSRMRFEGTISISKCILDKSILEKSSKESESHLILSEDSSNTTTRSGLYWLLFDYVQRDTSSTQPFACFHSLAQIQCGRV